MVQTGKLMRLLFYSVYKALQEYQGVLFYGLVKNYIEATSTIQYLVLRMFIHTCGWHDIS